MEYLIFISRHKIQRIMKEKEVPSVFHGAEFNWPFHEDEKYRRCITPPRHQTNLNICFLYVLRDLIYACEMFNGDMRQGHPVSTQDLMDHVHLEFLPPKESDAYDKKGNLQHSHQGITNTLEHALLFAQKYGVLLEKDFRFRRVLKKDTKMDTRVMGSKIRVVGIGKVDENDFEECKKILKTSPLGGTLLVFDGWSGEEIYDGMIPLKEKKTKALHCVLIVGYRREDNTNYFIIKNSWGPKWGHSGYAKVTASAFRNKGAFLYPKKVVLEEITGGAFIQPHLRDLAPYQPALSFEVLSSRSNETTSLDADENPYGPPPEVLEALGFMRSPSSYPDPNSRKLRDALAEDSGLEVDYMLAGCGSDELVDLLMRCVLKPGDKILGCPPTFTMYEFHAAVNGALVVEVPRKSNFSLDVPKIIKVFEEERPRIIFLTSPNNPDGSTIDDGSLLKILSLPVLVVLDEAYIEFADSESKMKWVKQHETLIVLRTLSNRAALAAGLRVGYGAFPLSIIKYLWGAKPSYNVSVADEIAACTALENPTYLEDVKERLVRERENLFDLLKKVRFLSPYRSNANFILCKVKAGRNAKKLTEDLAKLGIMIRQYNNKELAEYVRVSVGKPEDTTALLKGLKSLK